MRVVRPLLPELAASVATICERNGAITAAKCVRALPTSLPVDTIITAAIDVLRARGRDGLASQLASCRFDEPKDEVA